MPENHPPEESPPADDPFVVVTMDPAGTITTWNPGAETVCGWSAGEAVGLPGAIIFTDEDRAAGIPEREMATALRKGEAIDERWHRRQDGTTFWGSGVMSALRTAGGEHLGFVKVFRDLTGRRAGEKALRESEVRYRTLFTSMTEGFALCEVVSDGGGRAVDYRVLDVNPAYERVTGLTRDQSVGRTAREIVRGPEVEGFIETYGRVVRDHEAVRFESQLPELGLWLDTYAFPVDPAGDDRFGVVLSDVTERKRAETALRASADQAVFRAALADALRPLADPAEVKAAATRLLGRHLGASQVHYGEVTDEAYVVVDRDYTDGSESLTGRFRMDSFNPALVRAHGASEVIVTPDVANDVEISEADRAAYAAVGVGAQVSVPLVKGGRLAAVLAVHQLEPRAWTDAEVALVEETAERTWTAVERARAEAALRVAEERYLALFNAIDQGFCTIEVLFDEAGQPVDYRFLEVSPSFERQTGIVGGAGRRMREIAPDQDAFWFETYGRVALTGESTRFESFSTPLDRWWSVYAFRIGDPEARRIAVMFYDISERKRAEAETRSLNATLEARVDERTREVRRLAARLTVAEQAERERIAHVLHDDLQQHLYGATIVLARLRQGLPDDGSRALADRASEIVDEAARMTRTLSTELSPAVLQGDGLRDLLNWVARENERKYGLDLSAEVSGNPVIGPASRVLLYQALREVLFNVVKHSGGKAARITGRGEGDAVVVRVEDDGVGFDPEATSSAPAGFGLASVGERLRLVGGRIDVESSPGAGTRVTVTVPYEAG